MGFWAGLKIVGALLLPYGRFNDPEPRNGVTPRRGHRSPEPGGTGALRARAA